MRLSHADGATHAGTPAKGLDGKAFSAYIESPSSTPQHTLSGTFPADGAWTQYPEGATDSHSVAQDGFVAISGTTVTVRVMSKDWPAATAVPSVRVAMQSNALSQFVGLHQSSSDSSKGFTPSVKVTLTGDTLTLERAEYTPSAALQDYVITYQLLVSQASRLTVGASTGHACPRQPPTTKGVLMAGSQGLGGCTWFRPAYCDACPLVFLPALP